MYTNAEDYAKVKRRVADLYKEHEKELEEVILSYFLYCTCLSPVVIAWLNFWHVMEIA